MTSNWFWKFGEEHEHRSDENSYDNRRDLPFGDLCSLLFDLLRLLLDLYILYLHLRRLALELRDIALALWGLLRRLLPDRPRPAPQAVVESPLTVTVVESKREGDTAQCMICRDTVELGMEVALLPCKHWYHVDCIKPWILQNSRFGPYCFRDVTAPPPEPRAESTSPGIPQTGIADTTTNLGGVDVGGEEDEDYEYGEAEEWDDEEYDGDEFFDLDFITE